MYLCSTPNKVWGEPHHFIIIAFYTLLHLILRYHKYTMSCHWITDTLRASPLPFVEAIWLNWRKIHKKWKNKGYYIIVFQSMVARYTRLVVISTSVHYWKSLCMYGCTCRSFDGKLCVLCSELVGVHLWEVHAIDMVRSIILCLVCCAELKVIPFSL